MQGGALATTFTASQGLLLMIPNMFKIAGEHPFHLDSHKPTVPFRQVAAKEARFASLARTDPDRAKHLAELVRKDIDDQWRYYSQMATVERTLAENTEESPS